MTRTVLVTGATSGIGRAAAIRFAHGGWNVVGLGRRANRLNELRDEVADRMAALPVDVRDLAGVQEAMTALPSRFRDLDLLVNNAGTTKSERVQDARLEDLNAIIDTNVRAVVGLTWLLLPRLIERKGPSSTSARRRPTTRTRAASSTAAARPFSRTFLWRCGRTCTGRECG
jgi:serine 3-dehydrogenase